MEKQLQIIIIFSPPPLVPFLLPSAGTENINKILRNYWAYERVKIIIIIKELKRSQLYNVNNLTKKN